MECKLELTVIKQRKLNQHSIVQLKTFKVKKALHKDAQQRVMYEGQPLNLNSFEEFIGSLGWKATDERMVRK